MTVGRVWAGIFVFWLFALSGVLSNFGGGPGVVQALKLRRLLDLKEAQAIGIESEISSLDTRGSQLGSDSVLQEREIRKTLGYVASDEIIFDFPSTP